MHTNTEIFQIRFIRLPEVLNRTGFSRAWIYKLISEKKFPKQVKIGLRAVAFIESEIDAWIQETVTKNRLHNDNLI
ncbi:AlpA family transcriptional regulator [Pantoea ananatis]|uniref:helix-turn-helix transcriptional regulator n=1 Tax=Pantoea ananas TaxID=553 RepID=UPI00202629CE|nr:AlpA family transcriptional regulator [Pantoea ananatis]URL14480.1 AlpA family transcriptional regulator [Pantoea ananatis]